MAIKLNDEQLKNFWKKVDKNGEGGHWLWTAGKNEKGYGRFCLNGKNELAHRVSYLIENGEFPNDCACHRCDTPACVNPNHLWDGTKGKNNTDRKDKGRNADLKGEKSGSAKLTNEKVLEIRRDFIRISPCKSNSIELSIKYGVTNNTICRIISRKLWAHI